jgi:hypothetical protein
MDATTDAWPEFRKKTLTRMAQIHGPDDLPKDRTEEAYPAHGETGGFCVMTREGPLFAPYGAWLAVDSAGRLYPVQDAEQRAIYVPAAEDQTALDAQGRVVKSPETVAELGAMRARKDAAYLERNRVVAALARATIALGFAAGTARTNIPGWPSDWHGCVYIDTPKGQASWHYPDSHAHLFDDLPVYTKPWDGHTTPGKYERLAEIDWRAWKNGPPHLYPHLAELMGGPRAV